MCRRCTSYYNKFVCDKCIRDYCSNCKKNIIVPITVVDCLWSDYLCRICYDKFVNNDLEFEEFYRDNFIINSHSNFV